MTDTTSRLRAFVLRFRRVLAIAAQIVLMAASNRLAFVLRFDNGIPEWAQDAFWQALPWLVAIRAITFVPFRLYEGLWRYTSIYDLQALLAGIATSSFAFFAFTESPLGPRVYPKSIFITDAIILTVFLGGIRLTRRVYAEFSRVRPHKRVLVYGAGDAGELIVRDMKTNPDHGLLPVGFVDDDRTKVGLRIHRVPVLGTREELTAIVARHRPEEVLIAIPGAEPETVRSIVRALEPFKIPIKTLPNVRDIINGRVEVAQIRTLAVEDLLARAPIGLDLEPVKRLIGGRRVMVTGAGGSIGSELCRQIAKLKPASLVMLDRYENGLHAIRLELEDRRHATGLQPVIADVTDESRLDDVLDRHRPEIVFHAAAHKHVPLMEENPCEAIKNNVRGTRLLAAAAERYGVDRFILISTDKAVNPTSVMGSSKRVAELLVQLQSVGSGTSFSIVRFGNVLGSNGSVVPRFMEQIRNGGPVTITHPEMKRFFMTIPEAVQLVLHAAAQAEGSAIYVLEMGGQVKLVDMARDLIRLSGFVPDDDIRIEYVGLRPGEKLEEELVGAEEDAMPCSIEKILCVRSRRPAAADLVEQVAGLERLASQGQSRAVLALLRDIVGAPRASLERQINRDEQTEPVSVRSLVRGEQPCPNCDTGLARRSHARNVAEKIRREFTSQRLFRCDTCGWRGWLTPLDFAPPPRPSTADTPDLASLDSELEPLPAVPSRTFSPKNLA